MTRLEAARPRPTVFPYSAATSRGVMKDCQVLSESQPVNNTGLRAVPLRSVLGTRSLLRSRAPVPSLLLRAPKENRNFVPPASPLPTKHNFGELTSRPPTVVRASADATEIYSCLTILYVHPVVGCVGIYVANSERWSQPGEARFSDVSSRALVYPGMKLEVMKKE